jgi:hypothetical protein
MTRALTPLDITVDWLLTGRSREELFDMEPFAGYRQRGDHALGRFIPRHFAPVDTAPGLHWHPCDRQVLPPILDPPELPVRRDEHGLFYLPFQDQATVTRWLAEELPVPPAELAANLWLATHRAEPQVTGPAWDSGPAALALAFWPQGRPRVTLDSEPAAVAAGTTGGCRPC